MHTVAFATIKLNSQRVPHKNIQMVGGKPLCYYALNTAVQVKGIDDVIVYCSDEEITKYIPEGIQFLKREKWLDGDDVRARDTYSAFINDIDADIYIAILTTAPFIKVKTLQNALDKVLYGGFDSAFCVKKMQTFAWYKGKPLNYDLKNIPRTQELEPVYIETSGFFIFKKELWTEHGRRIGFHPYIQEVADVEGVDIDMPEDLEFARIIADSVMRE